MKENMYTNELYTRLAEANTPEQIFEIGNALANYPVSEIKERYENLTKKFESLEVMTPLNPREIAKSALLLMLVESYSTQEFKFTKSLVDNNML